MNTNRVVFHIDMDAFFASVEQRDNPEYRGKPVIVGARPGNRGVVSASSYEARRYGIHSAMPINEAYRRCPEGIFVFPRMEVYVRVSECVMDIFKRYSPYVEQISVDEAFLDMTGTGKLFGDPLEAAQKISRTIKEEMQLTCSIGIAPNKFLAKIASEMEKPVGITAAPFTQEEVIQWLSPMEVQKIWGIGKKSAEALERMGILHVGDLQKLTMEYMGERFGKQGISLYYLCRGIDDRRVSNDESVKSISREHTFNIDSSDKEEWARTLFLLVQDVSRRARLHRVKGSTVFVTWRRPDFSRHSKRKTLPQPTNTAKLVYEVATGILQNIMEPSLRLLGVGITGLDNALQTDLFEQKSLEALEVTEATMDRIVERFGKEVIRKGREIG